MPTPIQLLHTLQFLKKSLSKRKDIFLMYLFINKRVDDTSNGAVAAVQFLHFFPFIFLFLFHNFLVFLEYTKENYYIIKLYIYHVNNISSYLCVRSVEWANNVQNWTSNKTFVLDWLFRSDSPVSTPPHCDWPLASIVSIAIHMFTEWHTEKANIRNTIWSLSSEIPKHDCIHSHFVMRIYLRKQISFGIHIYSFLEHILHEQKIAKIK